eukprot:gene11431-4598_t
MEERLKIILSVIFFFVFCFPIWWYSTSVYQKELPHDEIAAFSTRQKHLPINLRIFTTKEACNIIQKNINKNFGKYKLNRECSEIQPKDKEKLLTRIKEKNLNENSGKRGFYNVYILKSNEKKILVSPERSIFSTVDSFNSNNLEDLLNQIYQILTIKEENTSNELSFQLSTSHRLSFSLLNLDPSEHEIDWNFEKLNQLYIHPFLKKVQHLSKFEVDSQILFYGKLPAIPVKKSDHWTLSARQFQFLLNVNDWKFTSSAFNDPIIQFLFIVPQKSVSPLQLTDYTGKQFENSYIFPRWGGGSICNVNSSKVTFDETNFHHSMEIAIYQLRVLLGLPIQQNPSNWKIEMINSDEGISDWEVDGLYRMYTSNLVSKTIHTLQTLSKTAEEMSNVPINQKIYGYTLNSLSYLNSTLSESDYDKALISSRKAYDLGEKSFFDSSMISQLFIPNSQKFAIYLD